jgi:hypothetical protein
MINRKIQCLNNIKVLVIILLSGIFITNIYSQGVYHVKAKNPKYHALSDYVKKRILETSNYQVTSVFGDSDKINYYYVDVYLGQNKDPATLILDTGSSIMCLTCTGTCVHCGTHENPHFKTETSKTFKLVKCNDSECSPFPHYKSCSGDSCGFSIVSLNNYKF